MKRFAVLILAATVLFASFAGPSMAKTAKSAKSAAIKCPYCGMMMPTKKTATMSMPIKIKGVTYYCCKTCHPAPKAAAKKSAAAKKM